jgi:STE24 endopeptidase
VQPFTAEEVDRSRRYHRPLYLVSVLSIGIDLALLALLTFGPLGDRLYSTTDGWPWWGRTICFALTVVALTSVAGWPLSYWAGYVHEHEWGFSTQTRGAWLADRLKGLAVGLVITGAALLGFVAAAHWWPTWWPAVVAAAASGLVLLLGLVAPLVLEPLFNRFRPLDDRALAGDLSALADRAGVPVREVLVADASRRTKKVNAYVSGLGRTRRVVVYDTLLDQADRRELRLVVAHELGHRRKQHVAQGTILGMAGAAVYAVLAWALLESGSVKDALGVAGAGDPRVIPFLLLLGSVLGLVASPLGSALSRHWEREADAFSIELTGDRDAFVSTHRRLALSNLSDLDPPRLAYLAWFSHPTPPERIASANGSHLTSPAPA